VKRRHVDGWPTFAPLFVAEGGSGLPFFVRVFQIWRERVEVEFTAIQNSKELRETASNGKEHAGTLIAHQLPTRFFMHFFVPAAPFQTPCCSLGAKHPAPLACRCLASCECPPHIVNS
jgi:hypothetical protein